MNWGVDGLAPLRRWVLLLLAAAIAALAVYLRLYHLGRPSFWHDEVFSLNIIDRPWGELWGIYFDVHPPLFYALLKTWLALVGHDEYGLRLLSVLFSLATLPALYLIGRRIGGPWLGLAAFLCLAISPFAVDYAQELRSYAFFGCICA
jgi:mannosyltransferase